RRPGASIGLARGVELGDRRPLPAVPPGALRRRGTGRGPVLAPGDPRAVPPRPLGLRLLADGPAPGVDPALPAEDRDDPAPGGLAPQPGLRRLPRPGAAADRLGLCPLGPPRPPQPLGLPPPGPTRHHPRRRLLRPDRLPLPVHLLGRRRQPLRAARVPLPGAFPHYVT